MKSSLAARTQRERDLLSLRRILVTVVGATVLIEVVAIIPTVIVEAAQRAPTRV